MAHVGRRLVVFVRSHGWSFEGRDERDPERFIEKTSFSVSNIFFFPFFAAFDQERVFRRGKYNSGKQKPFASLDDGLLLMFFS